LIAETTWDENGKETKGVHEKNTIVRSGLRYEVQFSQYAFGPKDDIETLFTGKVFSCHANGKMKLEANYKDGKRDGKVIEWYENGQKKEEVTYKDGELIAQNFTTQNLWTKGTQKTLFEDQANN
jgi:hypothetical protein